MDVVSLGHRTDIALLRLGGSEVEDRGDHVVVRTPHNPSYWWGNFVLVPGSRDVDRSGQWLDHFAAAFPDAEHVAIAVDDPTGTATDLTALAWDLTAEVSTVMSAHVVHPPPRPNADATYRPLAGDEDWARSVELRMVCDDEEHEPESHRRFVEALTVTNRGLTEDGHGTWFGAFLDGELVSQMGLLAAGPGLARFQSVETHPEARGRGLAGTLVHHVSRYGFDELGAETLVMVADPDYLAVRVYRSVGFVDGERQLQAVRRPG